MLPIKVALLWHFHQPYYKKNGEFILPWVRLHGVKDYWDLPELAHEYPNMKQTINIVPSLHRQIEEYITGNTQDRVQRLTNISASELNEEQKSEILKLFFLCNLENMIMPYPRYRELYEDSKNNNEVLKKFNTQDWLDLQVWYNLTWMGHFSRELNPIKRLIKKGKNFTEEEKSMLLKMHIEILRQQQPQLIMLQELGQVEISVSPMYHPILPLLCNSKSALEAMPDAMLPESQFVYPQDARQQIAKAVDYYKNNFGRKPAGMWPSEGSLSDEALALIAGEGIKWAASDEELLAKTIGNNYNNLEKYFPRKYISAKGEIALLFRDHNLSDAIGFVYSRWHHFDAVNDFCHRLRHIKSQLVNNYGEECLKNAVVPVILDGENCWEFYAQNGIEFRRELFHQLSDSTDFQTVTCSEACTRDNLNFVEPIKHICAGSWIYGNFKIWIGHREDLTAWTLLANARKAVEDAKSNLTDIVYSEAMEEVYIAEGSDWFWWYGDEHQAPNKSDFDVLFRWHLQKVYSLIGIMPPPEIQVPISEQSIRLSLVQQAGQVNPVIDGRSADKLEWEKAGYYDATLAMSAMHQVGEFLNRFWFASDGNLLFFRIDTTRKLSTNDIIEIKFLAPVKFSFIIRQYSYEIKADKPFIFKDFAAASDEITEFSFSKSIFFKDNDSQKLELSIRTVSENGEIIYPRQGNINLNFVF